MDMAASSAPRGAGRREEESMRIGSIGLTLSALVLVMAVACGGGDSKGSPLGGNSGGGNTWDVAKADDLAHAALGTGGELPGGGWNATEDDFDDDDKPMNPACVDFEGFKK